MPRFDNAPRSLEEEQPCLCRSTTVTTVDVPCPPPRAGRQRERNGPPQARFFLTSCGLRSEFGGARPAGGVRRPPTILRRSRCPFPLEYLERALHLGASLVALFQQRRTGH